MHIRQAEEADLPVLQHIFRSAVELLGPTAYSSGQVAAWASFADERDAFRDFILQPTTFVASEESRPLGFCGVGSDGHIASLYVRGDRGREGLGSELLARAIEHARDSGVTRLYAEASLFSRPLFLKFGFVDTGIEHVQRGDETFERYLVALKLPMRPA